MELATVVSRNCFPSTTPPSTRASRLRIRTMVAVSSGMWRLSTMPIPVAPPMMIPWGITKAAMPKARKMFPPTTARHVRRSFW